MEPRGCNRWQSDCLKGHAAGATYGDRAETGNGKGNSDDLAQTRALAERDDGERDREHRLKRCDHRRKPGRQPGVHRHEENPELPDTDEQTDGDNRPPAHVRPRHEEDRGKSGQSEAHGGKEKRGNDSRPMSMTTKFTAQQTATTSARTTC